jgi:hypothetical protein
MSQCRLMIDILLSCRLLSVNHIIWVMVMHPSSEPQLTLDFVLAFVIHIILDTYCHRIHLHNNDYNDGNNIHNNKINNNNNLSLSLN